MRLVLLALLPLLANCSQLQPVSEMESRKRIEEEVKELFNKRDYQGLNRLAEKYRKSEERTSSGLWKLTSFYYSLGTLVPDNPEDKQAWEEIEKAGREWISLFPEAPTPYLVMASILIHHGWSYRGEGWSSSVKPEHWPIFYKYLKQARELLDQNKKTTSTDPDWYQNMLAIARAEQWDYKRFSKLSEEAISRYPYYYQIYFTALQYHFPRWHGDASKVESFARMAVERTSSRDKAGMYARVYWVAISNEFGTDLLTRSKVVWKDMKQGMIDVLEQYPDQWNIQNFAFFACLSGDKEFAKDLFSRMDENIILEAWYNKDNYEICKGFVS